MDVEHHMAEDKSNTLESDQQRSRWQFSLRTMLITVVLLSIVFSYAGTYYRLSRRGMAEAVECNIVGFFYVPLADLADEDLSKHHRCRTFFAPANWIDRKLFGGEYPAIGILFHLSS